MLTLPPSSLLLLPPPPPPPLLPLPLPPPPPPVPLPLPPLPRPASSSSSPMSRFLLDSTALTAAPLNVPTIRILPPTPVPTPSLFGRFSFWGAAASIPTPLLTRDSALDTFDTKMTDAINIENKNISGVIDELDEIVLDQVKVEHDGGLLGLSWRNMLSITPSLSAALKLRNQDLHANLNRCSEQSGTAYGLPLYTSTSQVELPVNTVAAAAYFNLTGKNTQVADILAKKLIPPVTLIPLTITSTIRPVDSDLKDNEHASASSVLMMSIPSSRVSHAIEDPISPVVQLGHFSNGDRIHRRSRTPPPLSMSMPVLVPDLLTEVGRIESSTDTVAEQNLPMKSGVIQKDRNPVYLDGSSRTAAEVNSEPNIERMPRSPSSHNNKRVRPEFSHIEERSSSKGMLLHADTPDICIAAVTKDVSTPSSTTQTIPVPFTVHEDLSSPSSSSLSTSEDNFILIKPTIRAASRKISDYVQIV